MLSKLAILSFLPAFVLGQNYYPPPAGPASTTGSPATSSSASAAVPSAPSNQNGVINVDVAANGKFVFNPASITASVGTLVTFYFPGTLAHSVTQSSFANPCTYLAANSTANTPAGFDSGLVTASTFTINVTDTQPIWFFCKQAGHCALGMVGSINAPTNGTNTFDAFQKAAMAAGGSAPANTNPGVTGGAHAVATALPVSDVGQSNPGSGSGSGSGSGKSDSMKVMASAGAAVLSAVIGGFMLL